MDNRTHVGLDVHKEKTAVAVLRPGERDPDHRVIPTTPESYRKLVSSLGIDHVAYCYEAGPCGYDPYRILTALGASCDVIAPTLTPRRPGAKVKTDRLDARALARFHRAGELVCVRVPCPEQEAIRDLIRVREDLKADRRRAIQRLKAFLLRSGLRYPKKTTGWSGAFETWVSGLGPDQPCAKETLDNLLAAVQTRHTQLAALDLRTEELVASSMLAGPISGLRALKGIDTLAAATITSEVVDFDCFPRAASFMAYTGLVPREHSSGERINRSSITKTGNRHVRRILIESAWAYRHRPLVGTKLRKRQEGLPADLIAYSWSVQLRLHARYRKLAATKQANVAITAVARELAGFVWGVVTEKYSA